jgi:hypothetical protein
VCGREIKKDSHNLFLFSHSHSPTPSMSDPKYRYHPYDPRDNPRLYREPYEHPGYRPGYSYQARSLEAQSTIDDCNDISILNFVNFFFILL